LKHVIELKGYKNEKDLDERFKRTELFLDYLKKREEKEFLDSPELRDSNLAKKDFVSEMLRSFDEQRQYIQSRRQKALEKGPPAAQK